MPKHKALGKALALLLAGVFIGWSLNERYDDQIHDEATLDSFETRPTYSSGEPSELSEPSPRSYPSTVAADPALDSFIDFAGTIVVGGYSSRENRGAVWKFDSTGAPVQTFGCFGDFYYPGLYTLDIALEPSGAVVLAGSYWRKKGSFAAAALRLTP